MRVGLFAARKPARGACSAVSVRVVVARCCAVFVVALFSVIVDAPLVGCAVVGCLFSCRLDCESGVFVCVFT